MTHRVLNRVAIASALAISASAQAITIGEYKGNLGDYVNCDKNSLTRELCEVAQDEINQVLDRYDYPVTIDRHLFSYDQSMSERISNSCSRKTYLNRVSASVSIDEGTGIQLTGNLIDEPVVFAATLNTRNYVRFDLKDNFGVSTLFGCSKIGDDHYYADATSYLTTQLVTYFSLEPRMKIMPNGDFILEIQPIFDLRSNITFDMTSFDIHGASSLGSAYANISSRVHHLENLTHTILDGGNSEEIAMAAADPLVQTVYGTVLDNWSFGDPLELERRVKNWVEDYANDSTSDIAARTFDVTRDINNKIKAALDLDADGRAYYAFNSRLDRIPVTSAHKDYLNCGNEQPYSLSSGNSYTNACGKYAVGVPWSMGPITSRSGTLYEVFTDINGNTRSASYDIGWQNSISFTKRQPGTYSYTTKLCYVYLGNESSRTCSSTGSGSVTVTNAN